ncbi:MAG: DUF1801 domain-containing protein [archaeon]|nr:DUF1801 domain-containing protein [archaeon]
MDKRIQEYIERFPSDVQSILKKIHELIRAQAPEATEAMAYGVPTFKLNGNLVHFAAFKKHVGLYPTPSAIEKFKTELKGYETAAGTIKFPLNKPIPYELIRKIVKYRVKEQQ